MLEVIQQPQPIQKEWTTTHTNHTKIRAQAQSVSGWRLEDGV